ncbi:hypothetical protein Pmani_032543 [Petrolisthes manimaculis]|uniref:Uncharacterized protein n=1 Tax=Petrolisthes manimaculis TaxID=1843537 RepID=A0AAE1NRI4_9EUCA|nr:hypothetical protein Pmani_032543 [Petrolisthes manimaculis]
MKNLALFLVPLLAILQEGASYEGSVTCWAGGQYSGTHYEFQTSNPHLGSIDFDNTIESIRVTGVWLFYDHEVYNTNHPDPTDMFWSYGINYALNIPSEYQNTATSLRPAGCVGINDDCWNVYEGLYFAARTFAGSAEMSDLSFLDFDVSSIILTGKSAWTFCESVTTECFTSPQFVKVAMVNTSLLLQPQHLVTTIISQEHNLTTTEVMELVENREL